MTLNSLNNIAIILSWNVRQNRAVDLSSSAPFYYWIFNYLSSLHHFSAFWLRSSVVPFQFSKCNWTTQATTCVHACLVICDPMSCSPPAPLSTGFPRQEYWSGLPFPPPRDLPDPGTEPRSPAPPALAGRSFTTLPPGKPHSAATGLPSLYLPTLERSPPLDKPSQLTQSQQSAFSFKWPTPLSRKTHTSYLYLTVFVHRYNWILKYCQIFE